MNGGSIVNTRTLLIIGIRGFLKILFSGRLQVNKATKQMSLKVQYLSPKCCGKKYISQIVLKYNQLKGDQPISGKQQINHQQRKEDVLKFERPAGATTLKRSTKILKNSMCKYYDHTGLQFYTVRADLDPDWLTTADTPASCCRPITCQLTGSPHSSKCSSTISVFRFFCFLTTCSPVWPGPPSRSFQTSMRSTSWTTRCLPLLLGIK